MTRHIRFSCLFGRSARWTTLFLSVLSVLGRDGYFVSAPSMTTSRPGHTATLLGDGRVLITGGSVYGPLGAQQPLPTAELYDPASGTFRPTGSMAHGRAGHVAVRLKDGRVLVMEFGDPEIYDPATESFSPAPWGTGIPSATDPDGEIFTVRNSVRYFSPTAGLVYLGNTDGQAVLLPDGRVVSVGTTHVGVYDAKGETLQLLKRVPIGSSWESRSVAHLTDGNILIAGGNTGYESPDTNEAIVFDGRRDSFKSTGLMLLPQDGAAATLLQDGKVLISGGYGLDGYDNDIFPGSELYNPVTGQFSSAGATVPPLYSRATRLLDGRVLITSDNTSYRASLLYIPELHAANAASQSEGLAPGMLASLFGSQFTGATAAADVYALPTMLGGVRLRIRDSSGTETLARLLYASPSQINFEVPSTIKPGAVTLTLERSESDPLITEARVDAVAPGLFTYAYSTVPAATALRIESNGDRTQLSVQSPIPLDDRPIYLSLYGTGFRHPSSGVLCEIDGLRIPVAYAGPEGSGIPGLDQVNVRLPDSLRGRGIVDLSLLVDGISSNVVTLDVR